MDLAKILVIVTLISVLSTCNSVILDWCKIAAEKCEYQGFHIGCEPYQFPQNFECLNVRLIPLDDNLKAYILYLHNTMRDDLASGFEQYNSANVNRLNYPKASQMREITWDTKLQKLAEIHALKCNLKHDKCRSTDEYEYCGQNIGVYRSTQNVTDYYSTISQMSKFWTDERLTVNLNILQSFDPELNHHHGHFLLMINENLEKVGCGYAIYEMQRAIAGRYVTIYGHQITCDYSYNNIFYERVYTFGEPTSECGKINLGPSYNYRNLCGYPSQTKYF